MRLINADALILQMESDANQMEDPIAIMFTYAAINDIKQALTVDAVPVEWLRQKQNEHTNDGFEWIYDEIINEWERDKQNEQNTVCNNNP